MPNRRRTTAALTAAVAVAGAAVLAGAPAAQAAVVDVDYACETKIGPKSAVSPVDIKAVKSGSGYTITMSFEKGVSDSPVELPKGVMTPRAELVLGGDASGTVKVKGTPNTAAIPPDTPIKIGTLTGTFTPKKNGKVTFTAGTLTVHALGMDAAVCTPKNNPKPSLELQVTGVSGGSGTPPPADDGGGSDEQLPKTGPLDSAMALGTLGGTVLLTGAAGVLWLTRRTAR
ncbi:peptidase [Streptomyces tanashiensis]|uniref:Peptidase n=1 Tax=Streptomyces tanashiensis TaxID=67367 RepID=A0ABY6RAL6_9ACTN|nr:peptidase [Streptomyces tanashiensis]UZX26614.1 peptidase [Streptomyces tanashiensis]